MAINPEANELCSSGVAYIQNGEPEKALEYFNKAIALEPRQGQLYYFRASAYRSIEGNFEKALADYTEAVRLNPKLAVAYGGRATLYHLNGESDKAIADLNQAISLDSKDAFSFFVRGDIYANKQEWDKAIGDYETALRINPDFEEVKEELSKAKKALYSSRASNEKGNPMANLKWKALAEVTEYLNAIAYCGGMFIAAGTDKKFNNIVLRSTDGERWTSAGFPILPCIIGYGNGMFVAAETNGKAAYSKDGVSWNVAPMSGIPKDIYICRIAYGNGVFIAGCTNSTILYSTDGANWKTAVSGAFGNCYFNVTYGNSKFVAGGGGIMCSNDGISWTKADNRIFNGIFINNITYGDGKFVAAGDEKIWHSADGITWKEADTNSIGSVSFCVLAFGDGVFVGAELGKGAYSTDGVNWAKTDSPGFGDEGQSGNITGIAYGNGKFVAIGEGSEGEYRRIGRMAYWTKP